MKRWAQRTLSPDNSSSAVRLQETNEESPKTRNWKLKNNKLTIELAETMKQVHRVDECAMRRARQIQAIKTRLFSELEGLPIPVEHIDLVRSWLLGIVTDFHSGNA